jgi:lipopolysaccharide export system permease protein
MIKRLDIYIMKKFLGTFFLALGLIILVAIVFDFSERVDDFINNKAPLRLILTDYYLNFIPYFSNLFSYLFVFISVIFFTSKMSVHSEITAILSTGISYRRMLVPYLISATLIALFSFVLANYVIPHTSIRRLEFEQKYIDKPVSGIERDIHKQIDPGVFIYVENYNARSGYGSRFSMEKFENGELKSKMMADYIRWDSVNQTWHIHNYWIRHIDGLKETILSGAAMDSALNLKPSEFGRNSNVVEAMTTPRLKKFIALELSRGHGDVYYEIEKHRRYAGPFAVFILTVIGVALSSRKIRGGMGMHIGFGIALSFSYILFMQVSKEFARAGDLNPWMAVWLPNFVYALIAVVLYRLAPK